MVSLFAECKPRARANSWTVVLHWSSLGSLISMVLLVRAGTSNVFTLLPSPYIDRCTGVTPETHDFPTNIQPGRGRNILLYPRHPTMDLSNMVGKKNVPRKPILSSR